MEHEPINPIFQDPSIKTIEVAASEDIAGIIAVQNSRIIERSSLVERQEEVQESGALIYRTTETDLQGVVNNPQDHILIVSKEGAEVTGFGLCYSLEEWIAIKPEWKEHLKLNEGAPDILSQPTLYFRQIAVLPGKEGIGIKIEQKVFREARNRGYEYVIGDILKNPVENIRSMEVHGHLGFDTIGTVNDDDLVWTLVCKKL